MPIIPKTRLWLPDVTTRFWKNVDKLNGPLHLEYGQCWIWTGNRTKLGYGVLGVYGRQVYAHRLSWEVHNGKVPSGLLVCHKCDNPSCVNPDHLFVGNQAANLGDMSRKGRHYSKTKPELVARGDKNGARTHPERLYRGADWAKAHPVESFPSGDKNGARLHPEKMSRGEKNGNAALTEEIVIEVRRRHLLGGPKNSQRAMAREHNVSQCTIYSIVHQLTWRHLL